MPDEQCYCVTVCRAHESGIQDWSRCAWNRVESPPALTVVATVNGETHDITEGVRVLYDSIIGSADWGSGFLDNAEVISILETGEACGFEIPKPEHESGHYRSLLVELAAKRAARKAAS